jgi:hypothetical protein
MGDLFEREHQENFREDNNRISDVHGLARFKTFNAGLYKEVSIIYTRPAYPTYLV